MCGSPKRKNSIHAATTGSSTSTIAAIRNEGRIQMRKRRSEIGIDLWNRWNVWQPKKKKLNPCRDYGEQHQHNSSNQERGPNPDAKAAIRDRDRSVEQVECVAAQKEKTQSMPRLRGAAPAQ